ncbi:hypothetical protein J6590_091209, partial [Homalodisca vitripennis]
MDIRSRTLGITCVNPPTLTTAKIVSRVCDKGTPPMFRSGTSLTTNDIGVKGWIG